MKKIVLLFTLYNAVFSNNKIWNSHSAHTLEQGRVENVKAPEIAINYWNLSSDARLIDVIKVVREDEAGHRDVNHNFVDDLDKKTSHQNKTVEVKEKEVNITAQKK